MKRCSLLICLYQALIFLVFFHSMLGLSCALSATLPAPGVCVGCLGYQQLEAEIAYARTYIFDVFCLNVDSSDYGITRIGRCQRQLFVRLGLVVCLIHG